MDIKATLHPGQNGTKQLLQKYGDQLICVRYRYDKTKQKRYKTVELIVDEQDWSPEFKIPIDKPVHVRIEHRDPTLRDRIQLSGGRWDTTRQAWLVSYKTALVLGLESRILDNDLDL